MQGDKLAIKIKDLKEHYTAQSQKERKVWVDCYKNYNSNTDYLQNPYLSNLFIPKTHEAVELLAAFLVGRNQAIDVSPQGADDDEAAQLMQKLLEYQWAKVIKARPKLIVWLKQAILFGNGVMKLGWNVDGESDEPFMTPVGLDNVFMDYYQPDIQQTPVIHRIIRPISEVQKDERYKNTRNLIAISESEREEADTKFSAFDKTTITSNSLDKYTELLEMWDPYEKIMATVAPTFFGWKILREKDNPYKNADGKPYQPFVKLKFKDAPLPNRAYDMGAIEPTIEIQKAFNQTTNQFYDNVALINDKMWIKRRSANIDPKSMQRRPGGIIEVNDINADLKSEEVSDIKQSLLEMLKYLDDEFQQASSVVNLLKGTGSSDTATEAALGQQNVQTLLDMVDGNIKDALSDLGQILADLNIQFMDKKQTIKIVDNDKQTQYATIEPKHIKGKYDIKITADRAPAEGKAVRQKQLLDFLAIISRDPMVLQKYPDITTKIYKKWLEQAGINDLEFFFEEKTQQQTGMEQPLMPTAGGAERQFSNNTGLTPNAQADMTNFTKQPTNY